MVRLFKKYKILLLSIVFLFVSIGATAYCMLSGSLHNKILLNAFLARTNESFILDKKVKCLKVELNKENRKHFNRLFKDFHGEGLGHENEKFLTYYQQHNDWKKANITLDNETYKVKIKSHGKTPFAHKFGTHFSFKLKFYKKPYPLHNNKKISLIIYNRLQRKPAILKLIADKMKLPFHQHELISVDFDDHKNYLFYVEEPINQIFFDRLNLPWIIFNNKVDGSLIQNDYVSYKETMLLLKKEIKKSNYTETLNDQIYSDYKSINEAILYKNLDSLKAKIDINYFARINAMRIILGGDGHGFDDVNLEMAYDTTNGLFYPIPHRDINSFVLDECSAPYEKMDSERVNIAFWMMLNSDSSFIKLTESKIRNFIQQNSLKSLKKEIDEINQYYEETFHLKRSSLSNGIDGSSIIQNLECLKSYLKLP